MNVWHMVKDAFTPLHRRDAVQVNDTLRTEAAKLKDQAERTVIAIDQAAETGIWHQDLLEARGRYGFPSQDSRNGH